MSKRIAVGCMCFVLAVGTAYADVSNELVFGLDQDSSRDIRSSVNGITTELTDDVTIGHSLYTVVYRHFFEPLKDNDTPIDLRRYYQHPSAMHVALSSENSSRRDASIPGAIDRGARNAVGLDIGGELFLSTGTGLSLTMGGSLETNDPRAERVASGNVGDPSFRCRIGVQQYVAPNMEIHVAVSGETETPARDGTGTTMDRAIVNLGGRVVANSVIGFSLEAGKGMAYQKSTDVDYDIVELYAEIALYPAKQMSFRLTYESETMKKAGQSGVFTPGRSRDRTTLAGRYWFSERFSLELPIYSTTEETRTRDSTLGETTVETRASGAGLYAAYRF